MRSITCLIRLHLEDDTVAVSGFFQTPRSTKEIGRQNERGMNERTLHCSGNFRWRSASLNGIEGKNRLELTLSAKASICRRLSTLRPKLNKQHCSNRAECSPDPAVYYVELISIDLSFTHGVASGSRCPIQRLNSSQWWTAMVSKVRTGFIPRRSASHAFLPRSLLVPVMLARAFLLRVWASHPL